MHFLLMSNKANWAPEADQLYQVISGSFASKQATSLIVEGFPKAGKSSCIRSVIGKMQSEGVDFDLVTLSGLCHLEDRAALHQISISTGIQEESDDLCKLLSQCKKPVLIWMQEFEKWALTVKQSLLYALFSVCHANEAKIVVLGETSRFNCIELLEKRVKSRFSHRVIHILGHEKLESFSQLCLQSLPEDQLEIALQSPAFQQMVSNEWITTQNAGKIRRFLVKCNLLQELESVESFQKACESFLAAPDYWAQVASEMTTLSLGLLLTLRRITGASSSKNPSFEAIYAIYRAFMLNGEGIAPSRDLCARAFEQLIELGFIGFTRQASGAKNGCMKDFRAVTLGVPVCLVDEFVLPFANAALRRWCLQE